MNQYPLRLPEDLYQRAVDLARQEGVSLNQFFLYAIADMVSEVESRRFFAARVARLDPETAGRRMDEILVRVPDRPPDPGDELP